MAIDLKLITQLREATGAGLNDCKTTLEEAGGDLDKAIELMRKKGEIKAAKKADRVVKEGVVALAGDNKRCAVVALACETDFVSRGDEFRAVAQELADKLLSSDADSFQTEAEAKVKDLVLKIGENIQLAGSGIYEGEMIGRYLHANKKVAGIIVLKGADQAVADDVAMQIVAMSPKWLKPEMVEIEVIEKEKEIYREQLKNENKPEAIWDKIIDGKLAKFYEEYCLINQAFIKDEDKKIKDLLSDAEIVDWARFQV